MRWKRQDQDEIILPNEFIPLAEETGLIVPIGEWALKTACTINKQWQDAGLTPLRIAVNVSGRQFHQKELVDVVRKALADR